MYMNEVIKKREVVINKIKRFPLTVFLKKILPILLFLSVLFISFVFGLWNIRGFDYSGSKLEYISESELDSYLSEYLGKNIFVLSLSDAEKKLFNSNGYIKEVYIKKILPSKLNILVEELRPSYLGYSSERCLLFADTGESISEVCNECEQECITNREGDVVYIKSNSSLESNGRLIFFEQISSIQKVLSEFEYIMDIVSISNGIVEILDTQGHTFVFDITYDLDTQLARVYIVCQKIDEDMIKFNSLDLRFDRPVMRLE